MPRYRMFDWRHNSIAPADLLLPEYIGGTTIETTKIKTLQLFSHPQILICFHLIFVNLFIMSSCICIWSLLQLYMHSIVFSAGRLPFLWSTFAS